MGPEALEVRRRLEKAERDRAAEIALDHDPPLLDIAAFHCQQAMEKLLKAYPVHRARPFERAHDLVERLAMCVTLDREFEALRGHVEPLTPYAARFRYPGPADPPAEKVREALHVARRTCAFVFDRLPPGIRP